MENKERKRLRLFYYFSFPSSYKREIHFLQGKLRARPTVIKNWDLFSRRFTSLATCK